MSDDHKVFLLLNLLAFNAVFSGTPLLYGDKAFPAIIKLSPYGCLYSTVVHVTRTLLQIYARVLSPNRAAREEKNEEPDTTPAINAPARARPFATTALRTIQSLVSTSLYVYLYTNFPEWPLTHMFGLAYLSHSLFSLIPFQHKMTYIDSKQHRIEKGIYLGLTHTFLCWTLLDIYRPDHILFFIISLPTFSWLIGYRIDIRRVFNIPQIYSSSGIEHVNQWDYFALVLILLAYPFFLIINFGMLWLHSRAAQGLNSLALIAWTMSLHQIFTSAWLTYILHFVPKTPKYNTVFAALIAIETWVMGFLFYNK